MSSMAGVLLATRSAMLRSGLVALLAEVPRLHLTGTADSAADAIAGLREHAPSVMLIDAELAATAALLPAPAPPVRTLLLARHRHVGMLALPGLQRSCGCLRVQSDQAEVLQVLRIIAECERPQASPKQCVACPLRRSLQPPLLPLTPRERQVFDLISHGHANQAIARQMRLSVKTVESYREEIKHKLDLPNSASLVRAAVLWGIGEFPLDPEADATLHPPLRAPAAD